jgi:tetratricopeptide (TPR) repeat protein
MRINLPSAILLSGTVMLFSAASAIADTQETAKPVATEATVAQSAAPQQEASAGAEAQKTGTTKATEAQPAAATPGAAEAAANPKPLAPHGGVFKFGADAEKDAIVDAPADIEKARQLHIKAMDQIKGKDIEGALKTETEATTVAPHYWLPHAGMVYILMSQKHKPMDAMKEASLSIYGKHNAVAERNAAKLFQQIHWIPPAQKALSSAVEMEPDNWHGHIGLADLQLSQGNAQEALKTLNAIKPETVTGYDALSTLAAHYLTIDAYAKARELYEKAVAVAPDDAAKTECQ